MTHLKRTVTIFGLVAAIAGVPATAHAMDDGPAGPKGCYVTDSDGYEIPIHDGESVFVDGKIYTCRGGTVIVTTPPSRQVDGGFVNDQAGSCRTRARRRSVATQRSRLATRAAALALCAPKTRLARAR
jgi:hypothetical protein